MASKIKQLRFPDFKLSEDSWETKKNGEEIIKTWSQNLCPGIVTQLGIYALPGTRFRIHQINTNKVEELIINGSGIFSIEVKDRPINALSIYYEDYKNIINNHYIVIDMIYEEVLGNE